MTTSPTTPETVTPGKIRYSKLIWGQHLQIRMHSSRMHIFRCSGRPGGGCLWTWVCPRGVCQRGCLPGESAQGGGVCLRGSAQAVSGRGGVSAPVHAWILTTPVVQNDRRLWKHYYLAGGKKSQLVMMTISFEFSIKWKKLILTK